MKDDQIENVRDESEYSNSKLESGVAEVQPQSKRVRKRSNSFGITQSAPTTVELRRSKQDFVPSFCSYNNQSGFNQLKVAESKKEG